MLRLYFIIKAAYKSLLKNRTRSLLTSLGIIIGVSAVPAGLLTGWLWQTWSPMVALGAGAAIAGVAAVALVVWASASHSGTGLRQSSGQ